MTRVLIAGAGGHGQVVADILRAMQLSGADVCAIGYVDDGETHRGQHYLGLPVLGTTEQLQDIPHEAMVVAIGCNDTRQTVTDRLRAAGERITSAIHPSAIIASSARVESGSMVCAGAIINPAARVGYGAILNTACSVDHHNMLGNYVHVAPGARLGGSVEIGDGALIGIGSVVLPNLRIGSHATVAGGAVVTKSIEPWQIVAGVPARPVACRKKR